MALSGTWKRRGAAAVCLTVAFALLAVSFLLFSAWHKHNRVSGQICAFTHFEHGGSSQAAQCAIMAPPAAIVWHESDDAPARVHCADLTVRLGRAPPASA